MEENKGSSQKQIWLVTKSSDYIFKLVAEIMYAKFCFMQTVFSNSSIGL